MKYVIALILSLFALNTFAAVEVNTNGLSDSQKAELVKMAEGMKKQPDVTPDKVDKWIATGERFGKMMGGAAKEVGIAVNEFINTPVGKMTAALIVWNYMGGMIVHVIAGFAILVITFSLLFWYSRTITKFEITYDKSAGRNWLGQYPVVSKKRNDMDSEVFGFILFGYGASLAISLFTMFTF